MGEKYQTYLASREWALKREAVRERSNNTCEVCHKAPMQACHHLTYARIYNERLEDLQAICDNCHKFESGKSLVVLKEPFFYRLPPFRKKAPITQIFTEAILEPDYEAATLKVLDDFFHHGILAPVLFLFPAPEADHWRYVFCVNGGDFIYAVSFKTPISCLEEWRFR